VEGIITLKWPIKDKNDNEMSSLSSTNSTTGATSEDGFNALAQHGVLTFAGFK